MYDDDLAEEFYEQLESTIKEIGRKDLLIIQWDWNAKVGPDAYEQCQEQRDALEWEKPMKDEKDFWVRTQAQNGHGENSRSSQDLQTNNETFAR